jgi:beta-phosphoglucomutase-like phosphatase (HAD superfamily)
LTATGIMAALKPGMVFTAADVPNPKPAPDLFLHAARQNGVVPERCLVIEDSGPGVMAGVAAGMTVFGYVGLAHDREKQTALLREKGAHIISPQLEDLLVEA